MEKIRAKIRKILYNGKSLVFHHFYPTTSPSLIYRIRTQKLARYFIHTVHASFYVLLAISLIASLYLWTLLSLRLAQSSNPLELAHDWGRYVVSAPLQVAKAMVATGSFEAAYKEANPAHWITPQSPKHFDSPSGVLYERFIFWRTQIAHDFDAPLLHWVEPHIQTQSDFSSTVIAHFFPPTWSINFSTASKDMSPQALDALIVHELAHALLVSRTQTVSWGKNLQTQQYLARSVLAHQLYHESFADAFSSAYILQKNTVNGYVRSQLAGSLTEPKMYRSLAHNTFIALRLTHKDLGSLLPQKGQAFLNSIHKIASYATALSIAHNQLERETGCALGVRGVARYLTQWGYDSPLLPWRIAPTGLVHPDEPYALALTELMALRPLTPHYNPWLVSITRTQPAIEYVLEHQHSNIRFSDILKQSAQILYSHHPDLTAQELRAFHLAASELAQPPPATWVQTGELLFDAADWVGSPKTLGCVEPE